MNPLLLGHDSAMIYSIFLRIEEGQGKGINRDFFRSKTSLGVKLMKNAQLTVTSSAIGTNALPKFENFVIADHWLAANDET